MYAMYLIIAIGLGKVLQKYIFLSTFSPEHEANVLILSRSLTLKQGYDTLAKKHEDLSDKLIITIIILVNVQNHCFQSKTDRKNRSQY